MKLSAKAPVTAAQRAQLKADSKDIRATAKRKNITLDAWEEASEKAACKEHFELGCWLYYFSDKVVKTGPEGLKARIECAWRLFMNGIFNPGDDFFTVFDFGEQKFDTIFEMLDMAEVKDGLRQHLHRDHTGKLARAFEHHGWSLT